MVLIPRSAFPDGPGLGFDLGRNRASRAPSDARISAVQWPPGSRRRPSGSSICWNAAGRSPSAFPIVWSRFWRALPLSVCSGAQATKVEKFFMIKENTFSCSARSIGSRAAAGYRRLSRPSPACVSGVAGDRLASRLSALALLCITAVSSSSIPTARPDHILWTAPCFIIARGPGAISLDHLI